MLRDTFTECRSGRVLLFPLTNRTGKVRLTAAKLAGKHGEDAKIYWKQVTAANRKHLERVGLSETEIERQLGAFFDAVQRELTRIASTGYRSGGDAA